MFRREHCLVRIRLLLVLAICAVGGGQEAASNPPRPLGMADVVRMVQDNEKLSANIDITVTGQQVVHRTGQIHPKVEMRQDQRIWRSVRQNDWYRSEYSQKGKATSGADLKSFQKVGFDGQLTRVHTAGVFNKVHGRKNDHGAIYPHNIPLYVGCPCPLSVYLTGGDAWRLHWVNERQRDEVTEWTYEGEETVHGLTCHKVTGRRIPLSSAGSGHRPVSSKQLWLAEARSMLPIRARVFDAKRPDFPESESVVESFLEPSPGVWLPRVTRVSLYDIHLREFATPPLRTQQVYTVTAVNLDPAHPRAFFSDIEPNHGDVAYEIINGKSVDQYVVGEGRPRVVRFAWWTIIIWLALLAMAAWAIRALILLRRGNLAMDSNDGA
jgi:hypothetical protein